MNKHITISFSERLAANLADNPKLDMTIPASFTQFDPLIGDIIELGEGIEVKVVARLWIPRLSTLKIFID